MLRSLLALSLSLLRALTRVAFLDSLALRRNVDRVVSGEGNKGISVPFTLSLSGMHGMR